jgi:hypothetical protein
MRRFRRLQAVAVAAVLAVPAAAPAQTPGDEQYTDPFGGSQQGQGPGGGDDGSTGGGGSDGGDDSGGGGGDTPTGPDAPVSSDDGGQEPATGGGELPPGAEPAQAAPQTAAQAPERLPYTGADAGLLALGGTLLLAGGVALRVRLRDDR